MDIDKKIKTLEMELFCLKIEINSTYNSGYEMPYDRIKEIKEKIKELKKRKQGEDELFPFEDYE